MKMLLLKKFEFLKRHTKKIPIYNLDIQNFTIGSAYSKLRGALGIQLTRKDINNYHVLKILDSA